MRLFNFTKKETGSSPAPVIELLQPHQRLTHALSDVIPELRRLKTHRQLQQSAVFRKFSREITRITSGLDWENTHSGDIRNARIRVTAWNIERGIHLTGILHWLQSDPILRDTDVLLLTEVDIGMGRSGNHHTAAEIARALGMNYVFANSFLELTEGDEGERHYNVKNTLSLHGTAILSRFPIRSCRAPLLRRFEDSFLSYEKRLGHRRALICTVDIAGRLYDFAAIHLYLRTAPWQRALQMQSLLDALANTPNRPAVIGGDFNTHTYDMQSKIPLLGSFLYKCLFTGVNGAIEHYLKPEYFFDKPLFSMLEKYGFTHENFNGFRQGTLIYNFYEESVQQKMRKYSPAFITNWLEKRLDLMNGHVPMRLDWLAGKNVIPVKARTIFAGGKPRKIPVMNGRRISDHLPVSVDLAL